MRWCYVAKGVIQHEFQHDGELEAPPTLKGMGRRIERSIDVGIERPGGPEANLADLDMTTVDLEDYYARPCDPNDMRLLSPSDQAEIEALSDLPRRRLTGEYAEDWPEDIEILL